MQVCGSFVDVHRLQGVVKDFIFTDPVCENKLFVEEFSAFSPERREKVSSRKILSLFHSDEEAYFCEGTF